MGNNFVVTCKAGIGSEKVNSIHNTLDYCLLLEIIKKHFSVPTPLLETLAQNIEEEVRRTFPYIRYFYISIKKKHPALPAQTDSSEVILEENY